MPYVKYPEDNLVGLPSISISVSFIYIPFNIGHSTQRYVEIYQERHEEARKENQHQPLQQAQEGGPLRTLQRLPRLRHVSHEPVLTGLGMNRGSRLEPECRS